MLPSATARLARTLMDQHGLQDWTFAWSTAKRTAGTCSSARKTIKLSRPLTEQWAESAVRNTILHEIAHALAGPGAGHGYTWKRIARQIGCTGDRCWTETAESPRLPTPWVGVCPSGHTVGRHRRPKVGARQSCAQCSPRFNEAYMLQWERVA